MNSEREVESSPAELETRILMAGDLEFCPREEANQALVRIEELQGVLKQCPAEGRHSPLTIRNMLNLLTPGKERR